MDIYITDFTNEELKGFKEELRRVGILFDETNFVQLSTSGGMWPAIVAHVPELAAFASVFASYFKHRKKKVRECSRYICGPQGGSPA